MLKEGSQQFFEEPQKKFLVGKNSRFLQKNRNHRMKVIFFRIIKSVQKVSIHEAIGFYRATKPRHTYLDDTYKDDIRVCYRGIYHATKLTIRALTLYPKINDRRITLQ